MPVLAWFHFTKNLKFKVENGTIALIPQVLRIKSGYEKSL